jgi:hypothetical protein
MKALNRIRVALHLSTMTDAEILQLVVAIAALAPQSALMSVAAIAASVSQVATKGAAFKTADDLVTADEEKTRTDKTSKLSARGALENELTSLAGLVGTNAKTPADVASMALTVAASPVVATAPPAVPETVAVFTPKKVRGRAKASVQTGKTRGGRFVAQGSPDPIGPTTWYDLPGTGKSRTLTGASGTKIWVRFARVRGQLQSDWSAPVLVILP